MNDTDTPVKRYAVYAEGLNVFGRTGVPIVDFEDQPAAEAWATERGEPGRTWVIRDRNTGSEVARIEGTRPVSRP